MSFSLKSQHRPVSRQVPSRFQAPSGANEPVRIRPKFRRAGNLLLEMSIGQRLTLGFLLAALIATLVASLVGVLRSQALSRQSDFYQHLLQTNTSLTTGANFLQLMNTTTHTHIDSASAPQPSQETLKQEQKAIQELARRYDLILTTYIEQDLLTNHPEQVALLATAGATEQVERQVTLAGSALRTWRVYQTAQEQILKDIIAKDIKSAEHLARAQAEPTNADALSAIRALIQLHQRLANSIREAASIEEQNQLITTIIGAVLAFIAIGLVGWFISSTLIRRLRHLRQVTQAVEQGQLQARASVVGRDEIADVSAAVNAMLDAISRLVDETRNQRDALTNAAEHLFSDMRVVSAGDLRINAPVSDDPIGLLANAFNFTVSRFRRFVLRIQTTVEQMDVLSRQELERIEHFTLALNALPALPQKTLASGPIPQKNHTRSEMSGGNQGEAEQESSELYELVEQVRKGRERLQKLAVDGIHSRTRVIQTLSEQISTTLGRLSKVVTHDSERPAGNIAGGLAQLHIQEMRTLESSLQRTIAELQGMQQSTTRSFIELDRNLTTLAHGVRKLKVRASTDSPKMTAQESGSDIARLSTNFAAEMDTLAHKLTALTQEMRLGVIAFQLDTPEGAGSSVTPLSSDVARKISPTYTLPAGVVSPEQNALPSLRKRNTSRPLQ